MRNVTYGPDSANTSCVRPTVWRGTLIYLAFMMRFYAVFTLVGVESSRVGESAETLMGWLLPSMVGGSRPTANR
jgi:hypothetical protein